MKRSDDTLPTFVILAFCVFRVTRFLMNDTLIEEPRMWVLKQISKAKPDGKGGYMIPAWRRKVFELVRCWWCLSCWVAGGTVFVASRRRSIPMPLLYWPALAGAAVFIADHVEGS